jgi:hypothetical protein
LLGCWLLAIAMKKVFEGAHHFMYTLLEESLERFEDAETKMQSTPSSLTRSPRGELNEQVASSQNAPSEAANPSSLSQVAPAQSRVEVSTESSNSSTFKEEEVW